MCYLLVKPASTQIPDDTFASGLPAYKFGDTTKPSPSRFLNRQVLDLKHVTYSILVDAFDGDVSNGWSMLSGIEFRGLYPGKVSSRPWESSLDQRAACNG